MKPAPHFLPTRSSVIFAHTRRMLAATNVGLRSWSWGVLKHYLELVSPNDRQVPLKSGVSDLELFKAERHNAQQIARYMDGTIKALPADLEDAWVMALPEPFRSDCERELAQRRGRYSERRHEATEEGRVRGIGEMMIEFGQLMEAVAPAVKDGKIDAADLPFARRILNESDDVIAALLSLRREVTNLLPDGERTGA